MLKALSTLDRRGVDKIRLSPLQRKAADGVLLSLKRGDFAVLQDFSSDGKTTVLNHIHAELGGACIGARQFLSRLGAYEPLAIEEAFLDLLDTALAGHDLVIIDDLHLVNNIVESCDYTRKSLLDAVITAVLTTASETGKKMVFATSDIPEPLRKRAHAWPIGNFSAEDFEAICSTYLDPSVSRQIDFGEIHRFAPGVNAHQLRKAAVWLAHEPNLNTTRFCEYLASLNLVSNVEVDEVEPVTWNDLRGMDELIQELEAKVALPFENRELAVALSLKPKRGVLLAGPPGTGKTTIGRALAHRLRGKFFLVDGTMIAGSNSFYSEIDRVFSAAERNAPSVIFIDDADVIFGGEKEAGFYRYLLTKLDGLESASSGRICVMMTAMEPADLPAAILRSGRVELWLETRLPDADARAEIIRDKLASLPPPLCDADIALLASSSRGCTGADLKAAIEDGKLQFAYHQATHRPSMKVEDYFLAAIATTARNRRKHQKRKSTKSEAQAFGFKRE